MYTGLRDYIQKHRGEPGHTRDTQILTTHAHQSYFDRKIKTVHLRSREIASASMMRFLVASVALIAVADALTLAPAHSVCRVSPTARRAEAIVAQFGRKPPPPPPPQPKKGLFSFGGSKATEDVKASKPAKTVAKKAAPSPAPPKPVVKKEAAAPAPPISRPTNN